MEISSSHKFHISVMFRMYDTDKNGYLDQEEMDSIVDQMMTVAEYMGWETNELRPVSDRRNDTVMLTIKSPSCNDQ